MTDIKSSGPGEGHPPSGGVEVVDDDDDGRLHHRLAEGDGGVLGETRPLLRSTGHEGL